MKVTHTKSTILVLLSTLLVCSIIPSSLGFTSPTNSKRTFGFSPFIQTKYTNLATRNLYPGDDPGPPLNWTQSPPSNPPNTAPTPSENLNTINNDAISSGEEESTSTLKANRWSKYAPDASLPTEEFRQQLKENMKNDLEHRRAQSPNRGNQPAKSYLDSL
jgi:hypothetical protein